MTILEGMSSGFAQAVSLAVLPYLAIGSIFGLVVGIIPGLSGHFAMAMAVTFLYSMEPAAGIAFILAAHATVAQGGGLTAILFSTPGTGQNAATLLDGPPMRDQGRGGVAVGAAMASCFLGATFGALVLAAMLPILRHVVLFFGPPEVVLLAFLALTFVAVLGKEDILRSLVAALAGLLLAMIGLDNVTNTERFTFGSLALSDGLSLVPVILGLFAIAEMFDLWLAGGALARNVTRALSARDTQRQIFKGIGLALQNWWLVVRCSAIGTVMGLIPGLGSAAASFVAYGHAKQTSKSKEMFGKGNVEGVIGPEAANDAVEGGALASTIAFGIPGSSSMAILLSGLFILGMETGPRMVNQNVDIVFVMIFTIVIGNLIGTVVGMFLVNPMSRATSVRAEIMVPVLMAVIVTGAYATDRSMFDIGVAVAFGIVGFLMKRLNYSRAALLIGFVLGFTLEKNLYLAIALDGPLFWLEPIPATLAVVTIAFLAFNVWTIVRDRQRRPSGQTETGLSHAAGRGGGEIGGSASGDRSLEIAFLAVVFALVLAAFVEAFGYVLVSSRTPFVVMAPMLALIVAQGVRLSGKGAFRALGCHARTALHGGYPAFGKLVVLTGCFVGLALMIWILGHYAGIAIFMFGLLYGLGGQRPALSVAITVVATLIIWALFELVFDVELFRGLIFRHLAGYRVF